MWQLKLAVCFLAFAILMAVVAQCGAEQYSITRVLAKPIVLKDCDQMGWKALATVNQAWWEKDSRGRWIQKYVSACIYQVEGKS